MASRLSVRYTDGVEDSRNSKQATTQAWIKLIVKVWANWQAKSAVYVNELEWRERQRGDIRRRLVRGMICSVSWYTALVRPLF
jgi:hypothetical protein